MRSTLLAILTISGCLLMTGAAQAAREADVRLVRAHKGTTVSAELEDVADLLKNNIRYSGFTLLGRAQLSLPNDGTTIRLPARISVQGNGKQDRFTVIVQRDGETLINAVIELRDGVPIVLGGFPDGEDRLLLVIVAR